MLETEIITALADIVGALIPVVVQALKGGQTSDDLVKSIQAAIVKASDETMKSELGP